MGVKAYIGAVECQEKRCEAGDRSFYDAIILYRRLSVRYNVAEPSGSIACALDLQAPGILPSRTAGKGTTHCSNQQPCYGMLKELDMIKQELVEILACPKCKGPVELKQEQSALVCHSCRLLFPIRNDIPIMLIDEAETLPPVEE